MSRASNHLKWCLNKAKMEIEECKKQGKKIKHRGLFEINPDIASIQACILHDVIEDTPITYEDIEKNFSKEVADLCE